MALIKTKRIYEPRADSDGFRVLVDGIWPRGMSRQRADVDLWLREVAPSRELRQWYGHDPEKWDEFRRRYFAELSRNDSSLLQLKQLAANGPVTLVYSAREKLFNNASALKAYLAS